MTDSKLCCRCRQPLPRTLEYFGPNRNASDGLQYFCRACKANRMNELDAGAVKVKPHALKKRALSEQR